MISKNLIKLIKSLEQKKFRLREKLFVAEGPKVVGDIMVSKRPQRLIATRQWYEKHQIEEDVLVGEEELRKVSFLQHPQEVIALFPLPETSCFDNNSLRNDLVIALDDVQDPGNLGTIIRLADWFGIEQIICSLGTADAFSPKVVQATMGSIARVNLHYTDLPSFLANLGDGFPIYGTFLNGTNVYEQELSKSGVIIMGNEGKGISKEVERYVNKRLFIPSYPAERPTAESLNVAIATAITCAEFRRRYV